jgi:hypothetical protein
MMEEKLDTERMSVGKDCVGAKVGAPKITFGRGALELTGANLKVVWAEFSTLS